MSRIPAGVVLLGVAGGCLLLGVVLPFDRYITLVAAALAAAAIPLALAIDLARPHLGLTVLLALAVLLPMEVVTGSVTDTGPGGTITACFLFAAVLCAAWTLRLIVGRRSAVLAPSRAVVASLAFMSAATLSFVIGQFPWFRAAGAPMRAQVGGLGLFLLSGGLFLLVGHETRSLSQLKRLTWLFLGLGAVALVMMLVPGTEVSVGRMRLTTHGSVGSLFFAWIVAMAAGQAIWNRDLSPWRRWLVAGVAATALARGLFVTFSWASGWLPPLVALGTLLLLRLPRTTIGAAMLLSVPALVSMERLWATVMKGESYSWMTRVEALRVMQHIIERNPLLGFGPANYHYYTPLFPILGFNIRFNSHNNYVDLLAQTGLIGLLAFSWLSFEVLRLGVRLFARLPDGFGRGYAAGTIGGLASSLVAGLLADWIVPFVYNIGIQGFRSSLLFWLFLGGLLALRRFTDAELAADTTPARRARGMALMQA